MTLLEKVLTEKDKGNNYLKEGNYKEAETIYKNIINEIESAPNEEKEKKEIKEQYKFVLSNLALTLNKLNKRDESMKYDRIIIKKVDKSFGKSYARLILGYLNNNKLAMARYHYDMMKMNVSQDIIDKFPEVTEKLKNTSSESDQMASGMMGLLQMLKASQNK